MTTITQLIKKPRIAKKQHVWSVALKHNPQLRGRVFKNIVLTPRKPNSALRKVTKVLLTSKRRIGAKVPGSGYIPPKFSTVLVKGNGYKDTPSIKYSIVRGVLECLPLFQKTLKRSYYGAPKTDKIYKRRGLR